MRKERSDARRHRLLILREAEALFAEHGIEAVSMHQIAKAAGIGQGTLYRKYAGKQDLIFDLLAEQAQVFLTTLRAEVLLDDPDLTTRERLHRLIRGILDFWQSHATYITVMLTMPLEKRIPLKYKSPFYLGIREIVVEFLQLRAQPHAQQSVLQQLPTPHSALFDPAFTAETMLATLAPDLYLHWRQERGYTHEEVFERLIAIYQDLQLSLE